MSGSLEGRFFLHLSIFLFSKKYTWPLSFFFFPMYFVKLHEASKQKKNFIDKWKDWKSDKFVLLKFSFIELCYLCYILIYNVSSDNLSLSILKCFVSNIDL